jgi:hypothetical protein
MGAEYLCQDGMQPKVAFAMQYSHAPVATRFCWWISRSAKIGHSNEVGLPLQNSGG